MSKLCSCGASESRRPLYDARGIFVAYVCDSCETQKKSKYRAEIFINPDYDTMDETIEPEDY